MPYFSMKCSAMSPIALPAATTCRAWQNTSEAVACSVKWTDATLACTEYGERMHTVAEQEPPAEYSHTLLI